MFCKHGLPHNTDGLGYYIGVVSIVVVGYAVDHYG